MTTFCLGKLQHAFSQAERCHSHLVMSVNFTLQRNQSTVTTNTTTETINAQPESAVSEISVIRGSSVNIDEFLGSTSTPPPPSSAGNSALLGGVVKGANSLFSNIKDMSNKVMQSVAG